MTQIFSVFSKKKGDPINLPLWGMSCGIVWCWTKLTDSGVGASVGILQHTSESLHFDIIEWLSPNL